MQRCQKLGLTLKSEDVTLIHSLAEQKYQEAQKDQEAGKKNQFFNISHKDKLYNPLPKIQIFYDAALGHVRAYLKQLMSGADSRKGVTKLFDKAVCIAFNQLGTPQISQCAR